LREPSPSWELHANTLCVPCNSGLGAPDSHVSAGSGQIRSEGRLRDRKSHSDSGIVKHLDSPEIGRSPNTMRAAVVIGTGSENHARFLRVSSGS
jgi:hypothetical protein